MEYAYIGSLAPSSGGGGSSLWEEITRGDYLFRYSTLTEIGDVYLPKCNVITHMFEYCRSLKKVGTITALGGYNSKYGMDSLFAYCNILESIGDIIYADFERGLSAQSAFLNCQMLKAANFTSKIYLRDDCDLLFSNCNELESIDNIDFSKVGRFESGFNSCLKLNNVPALDFSSCYVINDAFTKCNSLSNFGGLINLGKRYTNKVENTSYYTLNLSACPLTHESLMNVINGLYDLNLTYDVAGGNTLYRQSLVLGADNLAKLTEDEIQIATDKGWNVT